MSQSGRLVAHTTRGDLRGVYSGGVAQFRGVPYAARLLVRCASHRRRRSPGGTGSVTPADTGPFARSCRLGYDT